MAVGEWDQRQLCPDGSCIGVIGPEGTCKVCGHAAPNWGDERKRGLIEPEEEQERDLHDEDDYDDESDDIDGDRDDDDHDDEAAEEDDPDEAVAAGAAHIAGAVRGEWSVRQLCPDGGCIGVIGPDGHCRVCGRAAPDVLDEPTQRTAAPVTPAEPAAAVAPGEAGERAAGAAGTSAAASPGEAAAAERERCPDAGCTGSIGADGRCAVCGKGAS